MSDTNPVKDNSGLSANDFDKFLDIRMEIAPKNIKLDMDYDSEPVLKVSLIVKFFFLSITDKTAEKEFGDQSLDPQNFDKCHLIPVPTIQYLNGRSRTNDDEPIIKKLKPPKKDKFAELFLKAMNHENSDKKTSSDQTATEAAVKTEREFKVELFQATQSYAFQAPIMKWSTAAQQFPVDIHRIRFAFVLTPINSYTDASSSAFEVIVPGRKSTGNRLPKKGNFYPNIKVKKFPQNADKMVSESILEFDILPNSMQISDTSPRSSVTKKINFIMTFSLVRHVLGPSLNALVPIYVIAFLTPFTCFFEVDGSFDDIAGYLVTLLLTLVAHRITIAEAQKAIMRFTLSDCDFTIAFSFVVIQMIIFVVVMNDNNVAMDKIQSMTQMQMDPYIVLFIIEEIFVALWILLRIIGIVRAYHRVVNENEVDLLETNDTMSSADYRELRRYRKVLAQELSEEIYLKSLFSINMKILLRQGLENEAKTHRAETKLPTNDVFRCRFVQKDANTNTVLVKIQESPNFHLVYTKQIDLPKEEEIQKPDRKAAKGVYSYNPTKGKTLLLEVQFLSHDDVFTTSSHREYKKRNAEKALKTIQENPLTALHKGTVVKMYLTSLWVEIFSVSRHNFWSKCVSDWDLLCLTWQQLGKQESDQGQGQGQALSEGKLSDASKLIQNLLDTGDFEKPKTA